MENMESENSFAAPVPKTNRRKKLRLWGAGFFLVLTAIVLLWGYAQLGNLPDEETIRHYQPESTVSSDWKFQAVPTQPLRLWVPLSRISRNLQQAVLISEDDTFYFHEGINWAELKKAFQKNLQRRGYIRGASTITMQLARNAFLSKEKTLIRKVREIILARRMEKVLPKRRIFELYLNMVEWGPNIYGAEAAARYYFGKPASDLNMAEASLLAAMLPNPRRFNPYTRMPRVKKLQKRVLTLLRDARVITPAEYEALLAEPIYLLGDSVKDGRGTEPPPQQSPVRADSTISGARDSTLISQDSSSVEFDTLLFRQGRFLNTKNPPGI